MLSGDAKNTREPIDQQLTNTSRPTEFDVVDIYMQECSNTITLIVTRAHQDEIPERDVTYHLM